MRQSEKATDSGGSHLTVNGERGHSGQKEKQVGCGNAAVWSVFHSRKTATRLFLRSSVEFLEKQILMAHNSDPDSTLFSALLKIVNTVFLLKPTAQYISEMFSTFSKLIYYA